MSKFGTVDTDVWKHIDFKSLDDDSKLMFLYLKTCDHQNMIGCFHLPILYMQADLSWTEKRVNQTLCKLFDKGFVMVDKALEMVLLTKHLRKHPLQNPNQAKGAEKLFNDIPKRFKYIKELAESLLTQETLSEPFANRLTTLCNSVSVSVTVSVTGDSDESEPPPAVFDSDSKFDEFWSQWPKRGDTKKTAKDKFKSKCKSESVFAEIMAGLSAQLPQFKAKENKFIPAASTWLNQERWKNEPEPQANKPKGERW